MHLFFVNELKITCLTVMGGALIGIGSLIKKMALDEEGLLERGVLI